jgi:hypothetical protein
MADRHSPVSFACTWLRLPGCQNRDCVINGIVCFGSFFRKIDSIPVCMPVCMIDRQVRHRHTAPEKLLLNFSNRTSGWDPTPVELSPVIHQGEQCDSKGRDSTWGRKTPGCLDLTLTALDLGLSTGHSTSRRLGVLICHEGYQSLKSVGS